MYVTPSPAVRNGGRSDEGLQTQQAQPSRFVLQSDEARLFPAVGETDDRRCADDAVFAPDGAVLIDVDYVHERLFFCREPLQDRSGLLTKHSSR